ncbi:DNA methyltransferase [uncultured Mucilaginibacter sp.]|uniref:DNA methyltransferase n=1 Tax=uncultured Mucilaginibacter sp. TaxID=797541 RepID=UPI0025DF0B6F|nr:DNA methyltransferase [uncultured Mucilaginibacter sp.]
MPLNQLLTIDEVAQTLKITRQTLSKLINNKDIVAIKINKSYRIPSEALENFFKRNSSKQDLSHTYLKETRGCTLTYPDKDAEEEILNTAANAALKQVVNAHNELYNAVYFGDNLEVTRALLPELKGKVDLIYIDPPFATGRDFNSIDQNHAYSDKLLNGEFLEFIRKRLIILRELLSDKGSIYLHIDKKIGHYVKIIMDEVFGFDNFINDITRIKCNPKNFARNAYGNYSDMILFYAKQRDQNIWNDVKDDFTNKKRDELFAKTHPVHGQYTTHPLHAPGVTLDGDTGKEWNGMLPPPGRHWRYSREELTRLNESGFIEWSDKGNPRKIVLAKEHKGIKIQDVWEFKDKGLSFVDYPTQKNHDLLKRIILNSSNPGSLVLDCFAGSGSTLYIANELVRKWVGIDNSPASLAVIKANFAKNDIKCNFFE